MTNFDHVTHLDPNLKNETILRCVIQTLFVKNCNGDPCVRRILVSYFKKNIKNKFWRWLRGGA